MRAGVTVGGRYRLVQLIGRGGTAEVWEAEHETLGSHVALKFVHLDESRDPRLTRRFLEEARTAAGVQHRHIVEIRDFGTHDGAPYMVMELLRGRTLEDALYGEQPVGPRVALELLAQMLSGLAAVHDAGLVHRDLKPANVFVAEDADGAFAKLLDFGLSRPVETRDSASSSQPVLEGTPQYMSPEQAEGTGRLDERTDIFTTGVVLYQAISGALPFHRATLRELFDAIQEARPTPLEALCPWLGAEMLDVVRRAMEPAPEARFQSARELREALIEALPSMGEPPAVATLGSRPSDLHTEAATMAALPSVSVDVAPSAEPEAPPARSRGPWLAPAVALAVAVVFLAFVSSRVESDAGASAPEPIVTGPAASTLTVAQGPIAPGPTAPGPTAPGPTTPGLTAPGLTAPGPTALGPTAHEPPEHPPAEPAPATASSLAASPPRPRVARPAARRAPRPALPPPAEADVRVDELARDPGF